MELGNRFFFINGGNNYIGVLKVSNVRQFDQFVLRLELLKFKQYDNNIINHIKQECEKNSTRLSMLKKVDYDLTDSCALTYNEIESYLKQFAGEIQQIMASGAQLTSLYNFCLANKVYVILSVEQAQRLYFDMESFYKNYFMLESIFKMMIHQGTEQELPKISNTGKKAIAPPPPPPPSPTVEQEIEYKELTNLDNILYFSLNKVISTSLVHTIFNYYKYVSKKSCFKETDENGNTIITIPSILPNKYIFNSDYFKQVVLSNSDIDVGTLPMYFDKLLMMLKNDEISNNPMYVMMISYMLFMYSLRYLYETHTFYLLNSFDTIISNNIIQMKVLNHHVQTYSHQKNVQFRVNNVDVFEFDQMDFSEDIKKISNEYKYLINVSGEEFVNKVISGLEESESNIRPIDFNIKEEKVLDLNVLKNNKIREQHSKFVDVFLFDPNKETGDSISEETMTAELLHYNFSDNQITFAYKAFLNYLQNPGSLMLIKDEIPLSVKNLFELLKEILTPNIFFDKQINTIKYYEVLCQHLPNANIISHKTILYIIFQIIVPYYYDVYKEQKFIDYLL